MDLLHINLLYQYLAVCLLNLIMYFVFSDPEPPLISVVYGGSGIYGYFEWCSVFFFISIIIKINHLYLLSISLSHTSKAFAPCGYFVILPNVCNLLLSLHLSAILLISSAYLQCASFLNLCCDFSMVLYLNKQSL